MAWGVRDRGGKPVGPAEAGGAMDLQHYEATGGLANALSRHADEAYHELGDDRRRTVAELMFKRLTELGADRREVRRPTPLAELAAVTGASSAELKEIIGGFEKQGRSFLTMNADDMVDISHESLIRQWPRLRQWVKEEADSRDVYRRLANAAERRERGEAALLRGPDLELASNWWDNNSPNQAWAGRYDPGFERASTYLMDSQKATKRRRVWAVAGVALLAALTVASVVAAVAALRAGNRAQAAELEARETLTELEAAQSGLITAEAAAVAEADRATTEATRANIEADAARVAEAAAEEAAAEAAAAAEAEAAAAEAAVAAQLETQRTLDELQAAQANLVAARAEAVAEAARATTEANAARVAEAAAEVAADLAALRAAEALAAQAVAEDALAEAQAARLDAENQRLAAELAEANALAAAEEAERQRQLAVVAAAAAVEAERQTLVSLFEGLTVYSGEGNVGSLCTDPASPDCLFTAPIRDVKTAVVGKIPDSIDGFPGFDNLSRDFFGVSEYGEGRAVIYAHDGVILDQAVLCAPRECIDNENLLIFDNALRWAIKRDRCGPSVDVLMIEGFENRFNTTEMVTPFAQRAWTFGFVDVFGDVPAQLECAEAVIFGNPWPGRHPWNPAVVPAVLDFVENGGGLLVGGLGWSYIAQGGPGLEPAAWDDYPANQLSSALGFAFTRDAFQSNTLILLEVD